MTGAGGPAPARTLYPMFVDVAGRLCLVVGGGAVATQRATGLARHGAVLRVVSPEVGPEMAGMVRSGEVAEHRARPYEPADLDGCMLAVAATDRREVNRRVSRDAAERGVMVNVADDPALCTFVVPAVVRRGDLAFAVTTGGASPVVAARIRRELEERYGEEWEAFLVLLRDLREDLKERYPDAPSRRGAVERLMATDVMERLADGDSAAVRRLVSDTLLIEA